MNKLAQLKKLLKRMSEQELEQAKALLNEDVEALDEEETNDCKEEQEVEESETTSVEGEHSEDEFLDKTEDDEEETAENAPAEEEQVIEPVAIEAPLAQEELKPKAEEIQEEAAHNSELEEVIEGLKARVISLEAENQELKSKFEGAFGYSSKPSSPVKVNKLYDDSFDLRLHK